MTVGVRFSIFFLFLLIFEYSGKTRAQTLTRHEYHFAKMGTLFRLILYHEDSTVVQKLAEKTDSLLEKLNLSFSNYVDISEVSMISKYAGMNHAIKVSPELSDILVKSNSISEIFEGNFDVTIGPVSKLWRKAITEQILPDNKRLQITSKLVNYRKIQIDAKNRYVSLEEKGMSIDLGGIAKGYAVDQIFQLIIDSGIDIVLVDGGGDLRTGNPPPGEKGWQIKFQITNDGSQIIDTVMYLSNISVATSGNRYKYLEINDRKYQHHIMPTDGKAQMDILNVTVFTSSCWLADALSTAVSVAGPEKFQKYMDQIPFAFGWMIYL